jgi:hypothetical protein
MADTPINEVFCPIQWSDLIQLKPEQVVSLSGAQKSPEGYVLKFLGCDYNVNPATKTIVGPPEHRPVTFVKTLVILTYLIKSAVGPAPGLFGQQVGAFEVPGGHFFFTGPHALPEAKLVAAFGDNPQALTQRALALGAVTDPPAAFRYRVLPNIEIGCFLNPADEEFPAQIHWTFDRNAHYYMPLDTLWGLINVVAAELAP